MRSLNWNSIQSSGDGEFTSLPAGPYVVRITQFIDVDDEANRNGKPNNPPKEYVEVVFDIAEGEHAGYYSDDWGKTHPYAHHFFMSYKESAQGMLKGRLEAIQASNPGFDPFAAWNAARADMFVNRLVGINLQEEEYERDGEVKTRLNVCQVVDAQRVRDGKVKPRAKKPIGGGRKRAGAQAPTLSATKEVWSGDIPFDE